MRVIRLRHVENQMGSKIGALEEAWAEAPKHCRVFMYIVITQAIQKGFQIQQTNLIFALEAVKSKSD